MDESKVSITAGLHAAFACPNTKYIDLDSSPHSIPLKASEIKDSKLKGFDYSF
tara:strand:- start:28 stop:186 length:159 start_codon:yes stop_codon:yes gene_type:complete